MKILALDLGTKTGYAIDAGDYPVSCGTKELASKKNLAYQKKLRMDRRGDIRFTVLVTWLEHLWRDFQPEFVVFEDVQFSKTTQQSHLWATWRAAVWLMAINHNVVIECCPVGTLKKFATGSGKAEKSDMARYLTQNPRFKMVKGEIVDTVTGLSLDDNAVDALHLLNWAKSILK